jgi:trehalose 6-phosphate phosphatase
MPAPPDNLDPANLALFLDVDGTLLDIEDHPADVRADPALVEMLARISSGLGGAMSLISGRQIADIDRIFAPVRFAAAGAHGSELRQHPDDPATIAESSLPAQILDGIRTFVEQNPGLLLEEKRGGVSLHYRRAPHLERQCKAFVDKLMPEIDKDFRLIAGKMVLELAPIDHNKGAAISEMMRRDPFSGRRAVFVGDDVTDEDGFRAVNAIDGITIRVGGNRGSAAGYALPDVAAVRHWLESIESRIVR